MKHGCGGIKRCCRVESSKLEALMLETLAEMELLPRLSWMSLEEG